MYNDEDKERKTSLKAEEKPISALYQELSTSKCNYGKIMIISKHNKSLRVVVLSRSTEDRIDG